MGLRWWRCSTDSHKGRTEARIKTSKLSRWGLTSRAPLQMAPGFDYGGFGGAVDEVDRVRECLFNRSACRMEWVMLTWLLVPPLRFLIPYSSPHTSHPPLQRTIYGPGKSLR